MDIGKISMFHASVKFKWKLHSNSITPHCMTNTELRETLSEEKEIFWGGEMTRSMKVRDWPHPESSTKQHILSEIFVRLKQGDFTSFWVQSLFFILLCLSLAFSWIQLVILWFVPLFLFVLEVWELHKKTLWSPTEI